MWKPRYAYSLRLKATYRRNAATATVHWLAGSAAIAIRIDGSHGTCEGIRWIFLSWNGIPELVDQPIGGPPFNVRVGNSDPSFQEPAAVYPNDARVPNLLCLERHKHGLAPIIQTRQGAFEALDLVRAEKAVDQRAHAGVRRRHVDTLRTEPSLSKQAA
jgi:hypothetical protein